MTGDGAIQQVFVWCHVHVLFVSVILLWCEFDWHVSTLPMTTTISQKLLYYP